MNVNVKNENGHKHEHGRAYKHEDEDENENGNKNELLHEAMSDPFLASGGNPGSLLAPQGVPWTPGRHPESLSGSGTVRFRVQIRSRKGPIGFEKYCNDVDCVCKI